MTFQDHSAPAPQRRQISRQRAIRRVLAYLRLAAFLRRQGATHGD